jgi:phosphate transport system ATP-binding protein
MPATAAPSTPLAPVPDLTPHQTFVPPVAAVMQEQVVVAPALHLVADNGPRRVGGRPSAQSGPVAAAPVAAPPAPAWTPAEQLFAPPPPSMIPPPPSGYIPAPVPHEPAPYEPVQRHPIHEDAHPTAVLTPLQIVDAHVPAQTPVNVVETLPPRPAAAPGTLAALEGREISAWFGDRKVLDRVSLLMPAGECTALIGPSGCGKSTFLRILNRMHELIPSASLAGEVLLDGQDLYARERRLTDARRQVGMVFQKPNPFPAMSIYDNVIAGLRLTGLKASQGQKDELVETCLMKAGLWKEVKDRLRQPGGGLSGGQQQRLCIARSLAIKPRVLLMDEPCSALDPTSTRRIEQTIRELVDEVTIVIVTHNMQQAARVSDKCAFFLAEAGTPGVIVEHGDTNSMFNSPRDSRTLDYVNGRFG